MPVICHSAVCHSAIYAAVSTALAAAAAAVIVTGWRLLLRVFQAVVLSSGTAGVIGPRSWLTHFAAYNKRGG